MSYVPSFLSLLTAALSSPGPHVAIQGRHGTMDLDPGPSLGLPPPTSSYLLHISLWMSKTVSHLAEPRLSTSSSYTHPPSPTAFPRAAKESLSFWFRPRILASSLTAASVSNPERVLATLPSKCIRDPTRSIPAILSHPSSHPSSPVSQIIRMSS